MIGVIAILIVLLLLILLLKAKLSTPKVGSHLVTGKSIPGPAWLNHYYRCLVYSNEPFTHLIEMYRKRYGSIFLGFRQKQTVVWISDVDVASFVLSDIKRFEKKSSISNLVRFSLSSVGEYERWATQRKIMNPIFKNLSSHTDKILEKIKKCLKLWRGQEKCKVGLDISNFAIDVLGDTIFDCEFGALDNKLSQQLVAYKSIISDTYNSFTIMIPFLRYFNTSNIDDHIVTFDKFIFSMVNKTQNTQDHSIIAELAKSFHANLISKREVRDNIYLFFLAGHETSANSLISMIYFLAKYPDVQNKLRKEVSNVNDYSLDKLATLKYLNGFIFEVLRFFPPSDQISIRTTTQQEQIGNYLVPANTNLAIFIYGIHHNNEYWADPETFNPDRWDDKSLKKIIPFGHGPRICIGRKLALFVEQLFLIELLKEYEISLHKDSQLKFNLSSVEFGLDPEALLINIKNYH